MVESHDDHPISEISPARVLVAEDQYLVAMDLAATLKSLGYRMVACVSNGQQAIDRSRQGDVDIAVLDVSMPVLDGLSAAETIAGELGVPVVLVTAYHDAELIERAMRLGVSEYLLKPVRPEQVQTSIEAALAKSSRPRLAEGEGALNRGCPGEFTLAR